jgi:hypothetical protein
MPEGKTYFRTVKFRVTETPGGIIEVPVEIDGVPLKLIQSDRFEQAEERFYQERYRTNADFRNYVNGLAKRAEIAEMVEDKRRAT